VNLLAFTVAKSWKMSLRLVKIIFYN
jgi:hypothetical protein